MSHSRLACAAAAAWALTGCSRPAPHAATKAAPVRITQFYTTAPQLPRGEKALVCYGVENARTVWLSPPRRELSAALARCIEIEPAQTTTYTLTAEGEGGRATQDLTVTLGAAQAKIIEVRVSSLSIKRGDAVSICYKVANAASVRIDPVIPPSDASPNCAVAQPDRTTTYAVTAVGAAGDRDQERVTVKVH